MHHTCAYSQPTALASAAFQPVPALADQVLTKFGNGFQLRDDRLLVAAYVTGPNITRAQIVQPSMRVITPPDLYPLETAVTPSNPPKLVTLLDRPFRLRASEQIDVNVVNNNAGDNLYAFLWLMKTFTPAPSGDVYFLHGSSTTTATSGNWTLITITWDQLPEQGMYSVVGSLHRSATGIVHRMIFDGQVDRPGSLSVGSVVSYPHPYFYERRLGEYGRFPSYVMPQVEVLCDAADTAHDIWLQLIKV